MWELPDWRRPGGGLKTREARDLLAAFEVRGLVSLPALRSTKPRSSPTSVPRMSQGAGPAEPLRADLEEIRPVGLRRVRTPAEGALWRELVDRHQPRGHRVPFGMHLRWLVEVAGPRPAVVACLQVSSPAWRLTARDRWIGWDEATRRRHLQRIVNHSRLLVLPWVEIPHLASHVLGQMARAVADVGQASYGVRPVLVETFVKPDRPATCYRAANWIALGSTAGRGQMDRHHRREGLEPKQLYVYPLTPHARAILRGER